MTTRQLNWRKIFRIKLICFYPYSIANDFTKKCKQLFIQPENFFIFKLLRLNLAFFEWGWFHEKKKREEIKNWQFRKKHICSSVNSNTLLNLVTYVRKVSYRLVARAIFGCQLINRVTWRYLPNISKNVFLLNLGQKNEMTFSSSLR